MQLTESSIYISLVNLRRRLYSCQFLMQKTDRMIYGTPLMQESAETLRNFILAFECTEKVEYLKKCIGWFAVVKTDLDFCVKENIIHFKKGKEGEAGTYEIELFKVVAKIDEDIAKWQNSLTKGKNVTAPKL